MEIIMIIETQRLIIRDLKTADEVSFAEMAADGSLNDIGINFLCNDRCMRSLANTIFSYYFK